MAFFLALFPLQLRIRSPEDRAITIICHVLVPLVIFHDLLFKIALVRFLDSRCVLHGALPVVVLPALPAANRDRLNRRDDVVYRFAKPLGIIRIAVKQGVPPVNFGDLDLKHLGVVVLLDLFQLLSQQVCHVFFEDWVDCGQYGGDGLEVWRFNPAWEVVFAESDASEDREVIHELHVLVVGVFEELRIDENLLPDFAWKREEG